jgi:hypothetical protein
MRKTHAAIAAAMLTLSACAAIQGQLATDSEQILAEAGFHREALPASSASGATSAGAQGLKARQLTAETAHGATTYAFYDPEFCHCTYVGGAKEYAELQRLRSARVAYHQEAVTSTLAGSAAPMPGIWGPWNPEGLDVK